jgi:hypothetical protein
MQNIRCIKITNTYFILFSFKNYTENLEGKLNYFNFSTMSANKFRTSINFMSLSLVVKHPLITLFSTVVTLTQSTYSDSVNLTLL